MKIDLGVYDWLSRVIVFLLMAAAVVGLVLWYLPLLRDNEAKRQKIYELEQQITQELERSNVYAAKLNAPKDPAHFAQIIETRAREDLNLARSNEVVFVFGEAETPSPR